MRRVAPKANIYIFNGFNPRAEDTYAKHKLIPVINSPVGIKDWTAKDRGRHASRAACGYRNQPAGAY